MSSKVFILAGEASGDMHGASLMRALKEQNPAVEIYGLGGNRMIEQGLKPLYHIDKMSFLGFLEVLKHLPFIRKVKSHVIEFIIREKIDTVVLIDYPGFNLSIARDLRPLVKNLIYYISPQLWAWGKRRVKKIRRFIDLMIVVFPFEKTFYEKHGVKAEFVGHPLVSKFRSHKFIPQDRFFSDNGLDPVKPVLLVLPGSREHEVKEIFPDVIKAAVRLSEKYGMQTVVGCADTIDRKIFETLSSERDYTLISGYPDELKKYSHFGIIKSGTSTVESALLGLPMVVVYKTSRLTYMIGKMLINIGNLAMVNILAGKNIVPEIIQDDVNEENIIRICSSILDNESEREQMKKEFIRIRESLGEQSAPDNAAGLILKKMYEG